MSADWEEIRRLAADFQRAQLSDSVQRLSERNCIEIVSKLIAERQLDVVHTLDGKEYITPSQISKEIRDELHVHGGRVNIVDLQQIVNVDLTHIESRANELVRVDKSVQLVLGQLVDNNYLDQIAEEVNDKLQEAGQVTISELCKTYDLPGDFLTESLALRLGSIIHGEIDQNNKGVIYTEAFVARHRARIRGLFTAITRPIPVIGLISQYGFPEHLLYSLLEELVNRGRLKGTVVGGRQDKAVFIPDIYARTQSNWIDAFLKQNGYLEYDSLSRLGIPDPIGYIRKKYKSAPLIYLKSVCVGQSIVDQVEASVEEAISSGSWLDIEPLLPSCFSVEDASILLQQVMRTLNKNSSARIFGDNVVVSEKFINECTGIFNDLMQHKAEKEMKHNPVFLVTEEDLKQASLLENALGRKEKKDERKKKATEGSGSTRGGGGSNAREIKIKKTKKKSRKDEDSDDESQTASTNKPRVREVPFMSLEEIQDVLRKHDPDAPDELVIELSENLIRPLTKNYQEVVRSVFMSSTSSSSGASRKQTMKDFQEEVSALYNNIRLFEKGIKSFTDETQSNLAKHLLKTVCTDITNLIFNFLAGDIMMAVEDYSAITSEVRKKMLNKFQEEAKAPLSKLISSLAGKSIEEFLSCLDAAADACSILVKKGDKKKERQVLFQHRQALIEQLKVTEDAALVLHLTSVLLFQLTTHCMLHAPGRCVPQIISFLSTKIPEEQYSLLVKYQSLVVKQLIGQTKQKDGDDVDMTGDVADESGKASDSIRKELQDLSAAIKDLVLRPRKSSASEE
ncbi:E3 UFM1-protein ligase 1 isoform X1 [Bufo bufo]|uniref:E3 UFM1-protein ligase 1 isoform X1 n=1 Tax=Bufo bufo TaxID=8384 RepID=UPI001ABE8C6C|nr:E3 UFM1-protein ligase 1 isoform X1 [Bufo bufo]XP_040284716.1 E3 UFM1-protein ligase 1 isoform X1 [Bufo bufo]